ncbi:DUF3152 domain-containing protein [Kribbella sp. NPDC026611]|uniref:DUF3152 domain-containing protein n=1 Tax=Kribbella sp. NPDC026611 TaxID=3154911 RepID=UPI0033EA061C
MRRWTVVRTIGLAVGVVVVAGALYQLPASPLTRHGLPDRVPVVSAESIGPAGSTGAGRPASGVVQKPVQPESSGPARSDEVITYPAAGNRSYSVLPAVPGVIGTGGRVMRFQIGIEGGIEGIDKAAFAQFVRATYGAPEGWASRGLWRFQQVGPGETADFMLLLVTPQTRDVICGAAPDRYTSCRIGDRVVLNVARWTHGVPGYGAPLTAYRQYMVNHETGHRLGRGHELCPGPGQPAPVMQQQTLGLHGCTAYAWPYLNGQRYTGRLGQYNDSVPQT